MSITKKDEVRFHNTTIFTAFRLLRTFFFLCSLLTALCYLSSCSFDYGSEDSSDDDMPDIVMDNVEYVRVRGSDPQARLQAERVERFENRRIMELQNFSFEQFGSRGEEVNAFGRAGRATFETDTGDILMRNGVRIEVESEDFIIETTWLQWMDWARTLAGGREEEVRIFQENGTVFNGIGFYADARNRTWEFIGSVSGTYIFEDDEEDETDDELSDVDDDDEMQMSSPPGGVIE